jgi:hypothetical protein
MTSFSSPENVATLSKRLAEISPELADIELNRGAFNIRIYLRYESSKTRSGTR